MMRTYTIRQIFALLLLAGWVVIFLFFAAYTLESPRRTQTVTVEIPQGASLGQIGDLLKEKKIIRESYFFRYYAILRGRSNLRSGVYEIAPHHSLGDVLYKIGTGKEDVIKIILPPGFTVMKLADRLQAKGFNKQQFLYLMNHKKPTYAFEKEIPSDPRRTYRLEGYLFPGTYYFKKREKAEAIIQAMLEPLDTQIRKMRVSEILKTNPDLPPGMTIDKWITVASLIEREGQVKSELPVIAGVIYNRMRNPKNNRLMIDASIIYIYELRGKSLNYVRQAQTHQTHHPYNTYLNAGLPPGPISSPSKEALAAALNPARHQYEFYVTKKDGTRQHYFARTYAEHQRYDRLSAENDKKRKR